MGEDVLGVQRDATQVSILLDEIEQLGGVGHPESQCSRDILLLLQCTNHTHIHTYTQTHTPREKKNIWRKLLEQQVPGAPEGLKTKENKKEGGGQRGFCSSGSQKEQLLLKG